jgi:hypothetical protein
MSLSPPICSKHHLTTSPLRKNCRRLETTANSSSSSSFENNNENNQEQHVNNHSINCNTPENNNNKRSRPLTSPHTPDSVRSKNFGHSSIRPDTTENFGHSSIRPTTYNGPKLKRGKLEHICELALEENKQQDVQLQALLVERTNFEREIFDL